MLDQFHLDAILLFDADGNRLWDIYRPGTPHLKAKKLKRLLSEGHPGGPKARTLSFGKRETRREGLVTFAPYPLSSLPPQLETEGTLFAFRLLPQHITKRLSAITLGYEDYLQLKLLHNPLKLSHFITFSIVTLLVIFAAIWFGFFLAKNLTVPIQSLVYATQRIADGDLSIQLETERQDELGMPHDVLQQDGPRPS